MGQRGSGSPAECEVSTFPREDEGSEQICSRGHAKTPSEGVFEDLAQAVVKSILGSSVMGLGGFI